MNTFGIYQKVVNFFFWKEGAENAEIFFSKPEIFCYQNMCHILCKKMHTHFMFSFKNKKKVVGVWSSEVKSIKWMEKSEVIKNITVKI